MSPFRMGQLESTTSATRQEDSALSGAAGSCSWLRFQTLGWITGGEFPLPLCNGGKTRARAPVFRHFHLVSGSVFIIWFHFCPRNQVSSRIKKKKNKGKKIT